jgi:hypothetical protein
MSAMPTADGDLRLASRKVAAVLKQTFLLGLAAVSITQACGQGGHAPHPPRPSPLEGGGEAGSPISRESAGESNGTPGAGGAPAKSGATDVAGAGGEAELNGAGGQGIAGAGAGGESSTSGAGGAGGESSTSGVGGETADVDNAIRLTPVDGWIDGRSNALGIQGAVFAYADNTTIASLSSSFKGSNACIKGIAAKIDPDCQAPAGTDCYAMVWGAAIGLNLNQWIDRESGVQGPPTAYDASALVGFAFELSGEAVPVSLRFKVEDAEGEYCTPPAKPIKLGDNVVLFSDLMAKCWGKGGTSAVSAKSGLIKLAWQVVTSVNTTMPFDYCVSNIRALR